MSSRARVRVPAHPSYFEMFFYAVLPLMLLLLGISRVYLALVAIFVTLVALSAWRQPDLTIIKSWTHTIIL